MNIVNCGFNYRHPEDFKIQRPNGSGDYILLILHSPAFFVFNGSCHHTNGNSVVIFKKGTPQIYGANGSEFVNDWIHFEADESDVLYFESLGLEFDTILELKSVIQLSKLIKNIFYERYSKNTNAIASSKLYFNLLILKIADLNEENKSLPSRLTYKLNKLRNMIFENPHIDWSIHAIAKDLSYSDSYLQHQYKLLFETTIKKDIIKSRLEYAKYLLFSTDDTIEKIAKHCGYANEVHFMRSFKKETGNTPKEYRNNSKFSYSELEYAKKFAPFNL